VMDYVIEATAHYLVKQVGSRRRRADCCSTAGRGPAGQYLPRSIIRPKPRNWSRCAGHGRDRARYRIPRGRGASLPEYARNYRT